KQYDKLSKQLHDLFQAPLLRAQFVNNKEWTLESISPIPVNEVPEHHLKFMHKSAKAYFARNRFSSQRVNKKIYDLAILVNHADSDPPSNDKALQSFMEAGEALGFYTELITKED